MDLEKVISLLGELKTIFYENSELELRDKIVEIENIVDCKTCFNCRYDNIEFEKYCEPCEGQSRWERIKRINSKKEGWNLNEF